MNNKFFNSRFEKHKRRLTNHINFKSNKYFADIVSHCKNNNLVESELLRLNNHLKAVFHALLVTLKKLVSEKTQSSL